MPTQTQTQAAPPAGRLLTYEEFRSGLTYQDVWRMMFVANDDPTTWARKSKGSVLTLWGKLKRDLYEEYLRRFPPSDNDNAHGLRLAHPAQPNAPHGAARAPATTARPAAKDATTGRPGLIPVRKTISHRGRTFDVTYWKKAVA